MRCTEGQIPGYRNEAPPACILQGLCLGGKELHFDECLFNGREKVSDVCGKNTANIANAKTAMRFSLKTLAIRSIELSLVIFDPL